MPRFPIPKAGGSNPPERTSLRAAKTARSRRQGRIVGGTRRNRSVPPCPDFGSNLAGNPASGGKMAVAGWVALVGIIVWLLAPVSTSAQPARTFEVLSGSTHPDSLEAGTMLTLTEWRISGSDTLLVWAERTTHNVGPSRHEAEEADRVAWCYPGRYPDERHLFPSAEVLLSFGATQEGDDLIMFVTESAYKRHYAGDLGWEPLALH